MSVTCPTCGKEFNLSALVKKLQDENEVHIKHITRLKLANQMALQAYDILKEQVHPPIMRGYSFDLCETQDGSFQLCINLDALTPQEARKESDELVAIWNSHTSGIS